MNRYADLENFIFRGFISYKLRINNVDLVLKSINDLEYETVRVMSGLEDSPNYSYNFHLNYLILSIYMINGKNILPHREKYYLDLVTIFKSYPSFIINNIFTHIDTIMGIIDKNSKLVEPYSYEAISRYHWQSKKGIPLNSHQQTGILGTEYLGLSQIQNYWTVLNIREDDKENFEKSYSLQKFLASFWNGKAVSKIENSDKSKKKEEEERRERIKMIGTPEEYNYLSGPTHTAKDLVNELNKQIRGEKDKHDLIVEEYEKSLRFDMLKQMQELQKMQEKRKTTASYNLEEARPISQEEMEERIKNMNTRQRVKINTDIDTSTQSKFLQMSNVTNEDVIKETDLMNIKEYNKLIDSDLYKDIHKPILENADLNYEQEQKKLAYKYGLDDDIKNELDFPNLRNR